jgi:uncharacterized protein YutD
MDGIIGTGEGKSLIHIGGKTYEVVMDHRNAYNFEAFRDRFSEVLERYDYIVGDWGYNQLRLKGFFKENNQKSSRDTSVACLSDYLNEYCNFGCAYFVLERVNVKNAPKPEQPAAERKNENHQPNNRSHNHGNNNGNANNKQNRAEHTGAKQERKVEQA